MQLQRALVANGENVRVDGVMGPETVTALRDYQQQHGLQPTGQMDAQTRTSLNLPG
jgi:peptidoglycan hydrolase-like protein with peptidoglycan-binding domain